MQEAADPAADPAHAPGASAHAAARGRVLFVSEAAGELSRQARLLDEERYTTAECAGGMRARVLFRQMRPHAVVISTSLRAVSHTELARMLLSADPDVGVVFVGAVEATVAERAAALAAGACDLFDLRRESELLALRLKQIVAARERLDRLRLAADCDYLTGLANRRRFRAALGHEVERFRRYRVPCALLLLDIDHLKRINDRFGHSGGDEAIRSVASHLAVQSRDNDTPARLGGEEFALLLANADERHALIAAERVRRAVSAAPVSDIGIVTVSIGVAACPAHANSERPLYAAADAALYRAKHAGRDRVELAAAHKA